MPIAPLTSENQYPDTPEGRGQMQADLVAAQTMLRNLVWDRTGLNERYVNRITVHRRASYGQIGVTNPERGSWLDSWNPLNERFVGFTQQQLQDIHIALRDGDDAALRSYGFSEGQITQLNANGGRQRHLLMRVADHFGQTANFNATRDRDTSDNWRRWSTSVSGSNDPVEDRANDRISFADMDLALNDTRLNGGPFAALMTGNNNGFIRSNQFDTPQAAQNATNQLLQLIATGLTPPAGSGPNTPPPTLSPAALTYMNTLFTAQNLPIPTGPDLARIARETGLPEATITALATFSAASVENRQLGRTVVSFLNTGNGVEHIHDNGIGVSGITAADIQGLLNPTSSPRAHIAYNALVGQINGQAVTLIRGGGTIATTQPATIAPVTVDHTVSEGTERSTTPVQLHSSLAARVNSLRTALSGATVDIAAVTTALRGNADSPPTSYREQLQMLREALRAAGTPADQVNAMTERQVWDTLRTRLGNTNEGVNAYLEFIAGGDPARARTELTALRADTALSGYFNQTTPPAVIARIQNNTSTTGPSAIPRLDNPGVINTQTGLMLDSLTQQLAQLPTDQQNLTKAQIDGLNGVFQAANPTEASTQLAALFPGTGNQGLREYFLGLYNDPRQRRLAGNLFNWMRSNTDPESQNNIANITSGSAPSSPSTVSISDLRILSGALQGRSNFGNPTQRDRAALVMSDFSRTTDINRSSIYEGPAATTVAAPTVITAPVGSGVGFSAAEFNTPIAYGTSLYGGYASDYNPLPSLSSTYMSFNNSGYSSLGGSYANAGYDFGYGGGGFSGSSPIIYSNGYNRSAYATL